MIEFLGDSILIGYQFLFMHEEEFLLRREQNKDDFTSNTKEKKNNFSF